MVKLGEDYVDLRFSVGAWEQIHANVCPISGLRDALSGPDKIGVLISLLSILSGKQPIWIVQRIMVSDIGAAVSEAVAAIENGMKMETNSDQNREVDVVLEELLRKNHKNELTPAMVISYGLIAGLSLSEIRGELPGRVCDLYIYRRRYDDEQHRIKRESRR